MSVIQGYLPDTSYHGTLIEEYFSKKNGKFQPIDRAISVSACGLFLCFTNRCGSTLLADEASALGFCGRPNNKLNYEFFNSNFVSEFSEQNGISTLQQYVEAIYEEFKSPLNIFFSKGAIDQLAWLRRCGVIGVGFPDYRYLRVIRRDLVAQAVSFVIAEQTKQWTSLHRASTIDIQYDFERIADTMAYFANQNAQADIYFSVLDIYPPCFVYEEIVEDITEVRPKLESLTDLRAVPRIARSLDVQKQLRPESLEWSQRFRREVADRTRAPTPAPTPAPAPSPRRAWPFRWGRLGSARRDREI